VRIIAGKYRGRKLKSPPSLETRPTSDRLRETLFNILAPRIEGARFLDLCAGSGAVGLEALSRGAEHVTFVDRSRKMRALLETNVSALKVDQAEFEIFVAEVGEFLRRHVKKDAIPFDVIFFDPPYAMDYETVLEFIGEKAEQVLTGDGLVVVEHRKKRELQDDFGRLRRYRIVKHGESALSFYQNES